jgi:hypothetical protein
MSCALLAPVYLALNHFYSMNALDILLWALAASLWISALETPRRRSWLLLGAVLGLGLLNKISVLWLGFGLGVGLLATPTRRQLSTAGPYLAVAVALTLFLPHLLWQILHGWPTVEFIRNATSNKMVEVALGDFAWGQIESMNIATVVVWLSGLVWLGLLGGRLQRSLAVAYLAVFALLALSGSSRAGYLSPAYTWLFAAGGVALEQLHARWRPRLLRGAILACIVVVGAASAPFALPILPVDSYIRYAEAAGVAPSTAERKELAQLPQFYADMHGWEEIVETVAAVFAELPPDEQKEAAIFVYNYGEAGAIDRLGRRHGLPRAIGGHNNYWLWGHRGHSGKVVLVVGGDEEGLSRAFETVELAATIDCGRCMPYENRQPVWVCRDILTPLEELWPRQRHFD